VCNGINNSSIWQWIEFLVSFLSYFSVYLVSASSDCTEQLLTLPNRAYDHIFGSTEAREIWNIFYQKSVKFLLVAVVNLTITGCYHWLLLVTVTSRYHWSLYCSQSPVAITGCCWFRSPLTITGRLLFAVNSRCHWSLLVVITGGRCRACCRSDLCNQLNFRLNVSNGVNHEE